MNAMNEEIKSGENMAAKENSKIGGVIDLVIAFILVIGGILVISLSFQVDTVVSYISSDMFSSDTQSNIYGWLEMLHWIILISGIVLILHGAKKAVNDIAAII